MADKTISLSRLRTNLSRAIATVERRGEVLIVSRHGEPVAVIMSSKKYDGWQETLDILSDAEFVKEIRDGIRALRRTKRRFTTDGLFGD